MWFPHRMCRRGSRTLSLNRNGETHLLSEKRLNLVTPAIPPPAPAASGGGGAPRGEGRARASSGTRRGDPNPPWARCDHSSLLDPGGERWPNPRPPGPSDRAAGRRPGFSSWSSSCWSRPAVRSVVWWLVVPLAVPFCYFLFLSLFVWGSLYVPRALPGPPEGGRPSSYVVNSTTQVTKSKWQLR
jgi:hypothetical protein